ncbi:MAG: thiol-activated cytolysin family protein [Bacteroidales bacterium]|nr:thiol-activated cytolysin family protein [Bacteroidales bacterium]
MKVKSIKLIAAAGLMCLMATSLHAQNRGGSAYRNTSTGSTPQVTYSTLKDYFNSTDYKNKEKITALTEVGPALSNLPPVIVNNDGAFIVKKEQRDISSNSEEFFGTAQNVIFPGNLIYVNKSLADGNPVACRFTPGKVQLTIATNLGGPSATVVIENSYGKIHDQIMTWLNQKGSEIDGSLDMNGEIKYYNSSYQMAVDLKVSVDYLQTHAHVNMNTTKNEIKIVSVENLSQKFYDVLADPVDNDYLSLFGPNVTPAEVKEGVDENGPIGFITRVAYGRRAYRFREYTQNDFTLTGDEQVKYSGSAKVDVSSTQNVTSSEKCSRFWGFVQGGYQGDKEIFNETEATDKPSSQFMTALTKQTRVSGTNPGVVINYTVNFLRNNYPVMKQSTGQYWETSYIACPKHITIEMHKDASQVGGSTIAYKINYKVIHVERDNEGNVTRWEIWDAPRTNGAKDAARGYVDFIQHKFSMGEERKTRTIPTSDCPDRENCYIYGDLFFQLKGNHASGASWTTWEDGWIPLSCIPVETAGPIARIYIAGSNYGAKNPYIHSKSTGKKKK